MPYVAELALYIVVCVLAALFLLFLFLGGPIRIFLYRHHTVRMYYRHVNRVAQDNDYYLINNFKSKTAESESFHIDHLLIGNKFIYCIRDRYYEGALSANPQDNSWIYYRAKNTDYISNPMKRNELRTERLSLITGIERDIFISIVLINDDCYMGPFDNDSPDSFLVSVSLFPKLIAMLESQDVQPLDEWEVQRVVADFATLKRNG